MSGSGSVIEVDAPKIGEVLPPLPSLEEEAAECGRMLEEGRRLTKARESLGDKIERLDEKIEDLRVALGLKLIGLRQRVEAGEAGDEAALTWWEWFEAHVPEFSRKHAERWMQIAASEAPEAAALEYRERDAGYQRSYRERQKPPPSDAGTVRGEPSAPSDGEPREMQRPRPKPTASLGDRSAMKFWSTLHAFQNEYLDRDPADIVAGMTDDMRADLQDLGPRIAKWLLAAARA
jgi:hypothetical protein